MAALTMPTLVASYKEKQTVTAVKWAYSTFSQAFFLLATEHGSLMEIGSPELSYKQNANLLIKELSNYIKKIKSCDVDTKCMPDKVLTLDGRTAATNWDNHVNVQTGTLPNGMTFWVLLDKQSGSGGQLMVDINGKNPPNQLGVDEFKFEFNPDGRVTTLSTQCDINDKTNIYNGYGCTALILQNENMDYLQN